MRTLIFAFAAAAALSGCVAVPVVETRGVYVGPPPPPVVVVRPRYGYYHGHRPHGYYHGR